VPGRLVEREGEVAKIRNLIAGASGGAGALALVEGAAGIGKTRLLEEAALLARGTGMRVLHARGVALEQHFAFGVVRQLFERPVADAPADERRELLSGAAGLAGSLLEFGNREPRPPTADLGFGTLHGLYWLMHNLATRGPVLIVLDDAHWADVASLRFVAFVAARVEGLRVLLLLALRPAERTAAGDLLEAIRSDTGATVLSPAELTEHGSEQLVSDAFGGRAEPEFCRACFEATGGNPFYLRTLADGLRSDGVRPDADNAPRAAAQVPHTVVRALVLRLARLPERAVRVARAAAVLGPDAPVSTTAALAELSAAEADEGADWLAAAGFFADRRPLRFMHPILQSAVYGDLAAGERSRMHLRAARVLAEHGAERDRIASHLMATEPTDDPWIVEMLRAAAADAMAHGVADSAVTYLTRARSERGPASEAGRLLHELGMAEFFAGRRTAIDHLREALSVVTDARERAGVARELGNAFTIVDRFPDAVAILEPAIEQLGEADQDLAQALEAQLLGAAALHLSTRPAHREHLRRVNAMTLGDSPTERQLLANLALWNSSEGARASVVKHLAERALAGGKLLAEAGPDSQMFYTAANALLYAEEFELARAWFDRALAEARSRGSLFGFAMASAMRSECDYRMGDLAEAEADAQAGIDAGGPGHWVLAPVAIGTLAQVWIERGQIAAAERLLARSERPFGLDEPGMINWLPHAQGELYLATQRFELAAQRFLAVGEWMTAWGERDPGLLDWRTGAALALAPLGDRERACELSGQVIALGKELGKPRAHGVGLRAAGVIEGSIELLREAVATLAGATAELEHARALIDLGGALRRHNHRREAREPLAAGVELARRCGATALLERGQAELIAAGARPRRVALRGADALTPSQRRVAGLAAQGLSTPEIAQRLFVTVNTVESHLRNAYSTLGIHSRQELSAALGSATGEELSSVG
jgi:DNA-binding CsgD family transcriptional regulator/tetratricopeptide (TPR) repeat protein